MGGCARHHRVTQWYAPDAVFDGERLRRDVAASVRAGRVSLAPLADVPTIPVSGIITPGFVDLQVNGGGGVLLNTTPTREGIAAILSAHRALGTVALMPTVITDTPEVLEAAADAALAARDLPGMMGLHIEGPHIAEAKRGTHAAAHIRPLDDRTHAVVARLRGAGLPVMMTVAPEAATPARIAALVALGAVVSLGHSDATAQQVAEAIGAGAQAFTHLFNAMSQMTGREPGMVGSAILSGLPCGLICDGHHVADAMIAVALRAGAQIYLVSDAMPTVGGPDQFSLYGRQISLRDGRLVNGDGALAGAHLTMADAVARMVCEVGAPLAEVLRMAITRPAGVMGCRAQFRLDGLAASDAAVIGPDGAWLGCLTDVLEVVR